MQNIVSPEDILCICHLMEHGLLATFDLLSCLYKTFIVFLICIDSREILVDVALDKL